jgi:F-type H+-transporting ATPase subunit b
MMPVVLAAAEAVEVAHESNAFGVTVNYVVMQIISFTILAFVLYRWGLRPVLATMDERNAKIADGLRYTEEMQAKLADAQKQHAETLRLASLEAQKLVDEARAAAKALVERETKQATEKTQQMMAKAQEAIHLEHRKMMADAREEIARLVALTAQRVLSRELSSEDRRRYADAAARELTNV